MIPRVDQDPRDAARYIGRLAGDLRGIAVGAEFDFLAYLLGMVEEEALAEANGQRAPSDTGQRPSDRRSSSQ